ncbi:MAG: PspC domain-containing protein [Planctomycetes bacterium]|nr:PspC domain-containing protein [Planctomycetota bacterium]
MASDYPLRRSRRDVQIAGVCGGLAEFFGLDVTTVRVVYVLASIFTAFAGVLIYIILWMIIPEREYD